ncbi:unnamed protein product [Amoebophrya sp. A120]|nr:unnamed protein product [Amoebophrya sp. A120]|eukprot:GSA120T00007660001.1
MRTSRRLFMLLFRRLCLLLHIGRVAILFALAQSNIEQQMGFLFQKIMVSMQDFERVKPGLFQAQQKLQSAGAQLQQLVQSNKVTPEHIRLLNGEESEKFHLEFLRLQKIAQELAEKGVNNNNGPNTNNDGPQTAQYIQDLEKYSHTLSDHVRAVENAVRSVDQAVAGGSGSASSTAGRSLQGSIINAGGGAVVQAPPPQAPPSSNGGIGIGVGVPIRLPGQQGLQGGQGQQQQQLPNVQMQMQMPSAPSSQPSTISGINTPAMFSTSGGAVGGTPQPPQQQQNSYRPGSFAASMAASQTAADTQATANSGSASLFPKGEDKIAAKPDIEMWKAQQLMGNMAVPAGPQGAAGGGLSSGQMQQGMMGAGGPNGQKMSRLEFLFLDLQNGMSDFEQLKPLFAKIDHTSAQISRMDLNDRRILQGIEAEELNYRMQNIEKQAQKIESRMAQLGPAEEKQFSEEVEQFVKDMRKHTGRVRELFTTVVFKNDKTVTIPKELPKLDPNAKLDPSSPEMRKITVIFAEIQSNMQIFERELAPRFAAVTPQILQSRTNLDEKGIMTGEESQKLHVRFVSLQSRLHSEHKEKQYLEELTQFSNDLRTHVNAALKLMKDDLKIEKTAMPAMGVQPGAARGGPGGPTGGPIGGTPIGGQAMPTNQPQLRTVSGGANAMPTPANFAGGGGRPMDPISKQINDLFEKVDKHMQRFEANVKPLFKNVPAPQVLMNKLEDKQELKIATGQASEEIHRRFLSIQTRANSLNQQQGPAIQAFILDLEKFEKDLSEHVPAAELVMKKASQMSQGSTEAYKKQTPEFSEKELDDELSKVEQDMLEQDRRLPTTLRNLKERMGSQLGEFTQSNKEKLVEREVNKMAHMLAAIKNAALEILREIRQGFQGKRPLKELNELFWDDFATESQRFLATIRDLQKEEMQASRESGGDTNMAENINMPGMKLTGNILGTSGVTSKALENSSSTSYVSRGMVQGGAQSGTASSIDGNNDDQGTLNAAAAGVANMQGPGGHGGFGAGGMAGLAKLPKLQL